MKRNYGTRLGYPITVLIVTLAALAGASGAVSASALAQDREKRPAYPLKKSANGRHLVDQKSVPFLIAGDAPQALMVNLSEADAEMYFANRKSHGFNAVWINLLCKPGTGGRKDGSAYDGILPFTTPDDLSTPNKAYFARCDRMIRLAEKQGLLVILDPCETIDHLKLMVQNGVAKCRAYGQYLGSRYRKFDNILWMSGNDFQDWKDAKNDAVVMAVARGIQDKDTRHLHTVELDYWVSSSLDDPNWAPIIGLNAAYTSYPTYAQVLKDYNRSHFQPVFMVEAPYEFEHGSATTPVTLRRQEYWTNLSGATGQVYGNGSIWPFSSDWKSKLDSPGAVQMAYVKALFEPRAWQNLVPDQNHTVVTAGYGTFDASTTEANRYVMKSDYVTAGRTPDGSLVMAYMPTLRPLTVDMTKLRGPVTAQWYDPSHGVYTSIEDSPFPNVGTRTFTPPGKNGDGDGDWILVLEAGSQRVNGGTKPMSRTSAPVPAKGPLKAHPRNPRYFTDGSGRAIFLTGSHTWSNLQDYTYSDLPSPPPLDFEAYLAFLKRHNHNFFRLWAWENALNPGAKQSAITYDPMPYQRPDPGIALDGKPKFDLTRFNPAYFDRMRARVQAAGDQGMYVSVMLFDGFSIEGKGNVGGDPWQGHPFHPQNNLNGVDGGGSAGIRALSNPAITAHQEAYVRKVMDTVNDLDNVLYEITNEDTGGAANTAWQVHMIRFIQRYEATKPKQHPVGMTRQYGGGDDTVLLQSPADWISPGAKLLPADGRKVILNDTDHSYFWIGLKEDGLAAQRAWVWENFTRGSQCLFMDPYLDPSHDPGRNDPAGGNPDPYWDTIRDAMGRTRAYALRMNLTETAPHEELASTGFCLANPGREYLVYLPQGGEVTLDLSASAGSFQIEWMHPVEGTILRGETAAGGGKRVFTAPFPGDAVLYLKKN